MADDFIRKPVEVELLARVRALLRLKHSVDERDQIARQRKIFFGSLTIYAPLVAADRMLMLFQQGALGELTNNAGSDRHNGSQQPNLLQMVNTLLEVYRFEAGRKIWSSYQLISRVALEVAKELTPLAKETDCHYSWILGARSFEKAMGDRLELHRLFTNLVIYLPCWVSYDPPESLLPQRRPMNEQVYYITIEVEDTGPGIPVEEQATLFEREGSHKCSGSGLGLYSRRIVEAHQGTLQVNSKLGSVVHSWSSIQQ